MNMARPLRITYPGAFYHITSRGNERKAIFKTKRDRLKFLEYLGSANERYNAVVHAYCLMDNHYHLLLETPSGNLPQIMRHINGAYTTYFNVKRGRCGHLLQGRYKSILVDKDEYAKELSRYIHLNPVRANMVSVPEDYEWSSYNQYIGKNKPEEWLARDFILGYFGRKYSTAQKGYKDFVTRMVGQNYESPLNEVIGSVLLGSQDFIHFIKNQFLSGLKQSKDVPAVRSLAPKISIQDISNAVEQAFGDDIKTTRNVKIFLCHKHTGEKLRTIGEQFGIGDSAVSQVCKRFSSRIDQDKRLKKKIRLLEKKILV
jgi:REP element-mobilizing transposase RayT